MGGGGEGRGNSEAAGEPPALQLSRGATPHGGRAPWLQWHLRSASGYW